MIVQRLIDEVRQDALYRTLAEVRIGIGYTAVLLDDGSCGVSYTFRNELGPQCGLIDEAGDLAGKNCSEIILWAMDLNLAKCAVGLACINAILQQHLEGFSTGNALEQIDFRSGDTVGMIGYFKPVLDRVEGKAKDVYIFERNITDGGLLPDWAEDIYLPKCDVVIITGTTLLNKTMDGILEKCHNAREIVVMGPTAALCPKVYREHGVTILAGVRVVDAQRVLNIAGEGGGGLVLKDSVVQVFRRLDKR
ncbi:MAG: DUF364 domain-containing protein [Bacillota bacterium]|nr:DUF364 domain-containing protein [Bacillota bacterium]MDD3298898.1 DUF364 domain-containing protein [Bacillota bacterium]MDD3851368.1 DUF364 domain-containing protein [Bacillota bacterium]MDD4707447.1 DUF364 domain-containing protein [Bacillota bacterium]